jgi:hypothetical protein
MEQSQAQTTRENTPLARVVPHPELRGRLSKSIEVPPGRVGILIGPGGRARTLAAGVSPVASAWQRLRGELDRTQAGYLPVEPFNAVFEAPYLLSGDDELLDASLFAAVRVSDAQRFFVENVLPRGEIRAAAIDLSDGMVCKLLAGVARCYAAADLTQGLPTQRLVQEIQPGLAAALANQGLSLDALLLISFWPSDERVRVAEKIQAIDERAQALAMEQHMAEAERQAALEDFTHQVQAEMGPSASVRMVEPQMVSQAAPQSVSNAAPQPVARQPVTQAAAAHAVHGWAQAQKTGQTVRKRWNLSELFRRKPADPASDALKPVKRPLRRWWLNYALWQAFLLAVALVGTRMVLLLEKRISNEMLYGTVISIWLIVVPLLLDSVRRYVARREEIAQAAWVLPGATRLDQVVGNNRKHADRVVREQCQVEVQRAASLLEGLVGRCYSAGETDQALLLRKLRQKFSDAAERLMRMDVGVPAYLSDLRLSPQAWDRMLDYDEELLVHANVLAEKTLHCQQAWLTGVHDEASLVELEGDLDSLLYRFEGRARALRQ